MQALKHDSYNCVIYTLLVLTATQFGILPQLEFDGGRRLSGNGAIARYLAEKYGTTTT